MLHTLKDRVKEMANGGSLGINFCPNLLSFHSTNHQTLSQALTTSRNFTVWHPQRRLTVGSKLVRYGNRSVKEPFKLSDVDNLLLWAGDDQVTQNTQMKTSASREEALVFIRDVCIPHPWSRSICLDDRSIGTIWVLPWSGDDNFKADLGYAIAPNYWGQGITTRGLKFVLSQVFQDYPDLLRLQAFTTLENKASQRVLEKTGFLREGVLRKYTYHKGNVKDLVAFSFLSTEEIPPAD